MTALCHWVIPLSSEKLWSIKPPRLWEMLESCAGIFLFHLFLVLLLWLKFRDVWSPSNNISVSLEQCFHSAAHGWVFWIGSKYWTPWVPQKSWAVVHGERKGQLACKGVRGHCQAPPLIVSEEDCRLQPSGLRTSIVKSGYYRSSRIWSLLYHDCLEFHWASFNSYVWMLYLFWCIWGLKVIKAHWVELGD